MGETIKLRKDLDTLKTAKPAVPIDRKGAIWVQPTLIAKTEYRAWTATQSCGILPTRGCERSRTTQTSIGFRMDEPLVGPFSIPELHFLNLISLDLRCSTPARMGGASEGELCIPNGAENAHVRAH